MRAAAHAGVSNARPQHPGGGGNAPRGGSPTPTVVARASVPGCCRGSTPGAHRRKQETQEQQHTAGGGSGPPRTTLTLTPRSLFSSRGGHGALPQSPADSCPAVGPSGTQNERTAEGERKGQPWTTTAPTPRGEPVSPRGGLGAPPRKPIDGYRHAPDKQHTAGGGWRPPPTNPDTDASRGNTLPCGDRGAPPTVSHGQVPGGALPGKPISQPAGQQENRRARPRR